MYKYVFDNRLLVFRAGMVMQLKEAVSADYIVSRDRKIMREVTAALKSKLSNGQLVLLGRGTQLPDSHLPVISFLVRAPSGNCFLHHNFVVALLNDLFGIQGRGGCACSGKYIPILYFLPQTLFRHAC